VNEVLADCECDACVAGNLAQGKTATQVNIQQGPSLAVDGMPNTPSATMMQSDTWWAVDLGAQYDIATVNVTSYTYNNDDKYGHYRASCFIHSFFHSLNGNASITNGISMIVHKFRF